MSSEISDALRRLVAARADHLCEYCLVHETDVYHGCEVDHIKSVGSTSARTDKLVRFYNPRTDHWREHFYLSESRIEPLNEIGEVTVRLLEFNHPERVAFRKILADTGRYPRIEALARMRA